MEVRLMISEKIKAILSLTGNKQADLARHLSIAPQSVANKMSRDSWSACDLVTVAEMVGAKLEFVLPDGQQIIIASGTQSEE